MDNIYSINPHGPTDGHLGLGFLVCPPHTHSFQDSSDLVSHALYSLVGVSDPKDRTGKMVLPSFKEYLLSFVSGTLTL